MTIIAGQFKGRKILEPTDKKTRPLKDLVRESIFNILEHSKGQLPKLNNSYVLDLFSGTGSFGIECLSRGARKVIFFENYFNSIKILKKNIISLKLEKKTNILKKNAYDFNKTNLKIKQFDLVFLDPPFKDNKVFKLINEIKKSKFINDETLLILHRNKKYKENFDENIKILKEKSYGLSRIIFGKIN